MEPAPRTKLAIIGGFTRPRENIAHGTHHAAYLTCEAIAQAGRYSGIDLYNDGAGQGARGELVTPPTPVCRVFDKTQLVATEERYEAIYVSNGEQIGPAPALLRPQHDWVPVIQSVGTAHASAQWQSLLVALLSDGLRATDGLIFKSKASARLFADVWRMWRERFGLATEFPGAQTIISNGVDVEANRQSPALRVLTRNRLRLAADDVVFLGFSRLSPATKGDQLALIAQWKAIAARFPKALLLLTGAEVDRSFVVELRQLARAVGVSDRVVVLENPFEVLANARCALMSAADGFIHMTTGIEETSSLVVHEALAHSLPVIATAWAGLPEVIRHESDGFLIETRAFPVPDPLRAGIFAGVEAAIGLGASRAVTCDWKAFQDAIGAVVDDRRRAAMSAAARLNAEAHALPAIGRAYVDFFAEVSRQAARVWPAVRKFRPLVELDDVVRAQATRAVVPSDRIRLCATAEVRRLTEGFSPADPAEFTAVVRDLEAAGPAGRSVAEVGAVISGLTKAHESVDERGDIDRAVRRASHLVVRFLNQGIAEWVTASPPY